MIWANRLREMRVRIFLISIFVVLSGCSEPMPSSEGNVTINIATPMADGAASAPDETLAGVLLTTAYPHLGAVTMTVFDMSQDLNISASVNRDYNGNRFGSVAATDLFYRGDDAFYVVDSTFSLNVPNDTDLSFTITAFNVTGYQIYTATAQLTAAQLAAGSSALPMAMVVDIDPTVPVQFSVSGCLDSDGDDLCDVYEDLFFRLNCPAPADPAEINDIDCDDLSNKNDPDSDGDGVTDDIDGLAPSNDGFPSFIHINNDPTGVSLNMVTDMGVAVTGTAIVDDVDVGDCHSIGIATQPANGVAQILAGGAIDPNDPYACVFYGVNYTPNPSFVGSDSFTITARDRVGDALNSLPITGTVNVTVNGINSPPVANGQIVSVNEDASVAITLTGSDPDDPTGSTLSYTLTAAPTNGVLSGTAPDVSYQPNTNFNGTDSFSFTVSDGVDVSAAAAVDINVAPVNDAPTISGVPATTVNEDSIYLFTPAASDVDVGDTLSFSIVNKPGWASFNAATGELIGTPANSDVGTTTGIIITVTDSAASASLTAFSLTVVNINDAPSITSTAPTTATEDVLYTYTATVVDVDDANNGTDLTWSLLNAPTGMSVSTTGVVSWTPVNGDTTSGAVTLSVADGGEDGAAAASEIFTIAVTAVNDAPSITSTAPTTATEDVLYTYTATVVDVDDANNGTDLTWSLLNAPTGMSVSTTGVVSWTPVNGDTTSGAVTLSVADGGEDGAAATSEIFTIAVTAVNDAPSITSTAPTTATEDVLYTYTATVVDVDDANNGTDLTWSLLNAPTGMSVSTTGVVSWTPVNGDTTSGAVTLSVADGGEDGAAAVSEIFTIAVTAVNDAPSITSTAPTTATEDVLYTYTATVVDVDDANNGTDLTWSLLNAPAGMSVSTTGVVSWTPVNGDTTSGAVTLSVADGGEDGAAAASEVFTIAVTAVNDAPVAVDDTAVTVDYVGVLIDLLANDSDVDGDTLSISAFGPTSGGFVTDIGNGRIFYEPLTTTSGDAFTYTIIDGQGGSAVGNVTVTINIDTDNDGLSDLDEATTGTSLILSDHDSDGFVDGHELAAGSDPLSNASTPAGTVISSADGSNVISGDVVWDLAGSPYWVQENVSVISGGNLIIEPFVAVKYGSGITQTVGSGGSMRVFGAPGVDSYVTFTSELDDTVQGDTGGLSTLPAAGDWGHVQFAGGDGEINYSNMRYGQTTLWIQDASPDILVLNANNCGAYCVYISSSDSGVITAPYLSSLFLETPASGAQHAISIVNGSGASSLAPVLDGFNTIDLLDSLDIGIYVSGFGAEPIVNGYGGANDGIDVTGGGYGLSITNSAAGSYSGLLISQAGSDGIRLDTTGAPTLSGNIILNSGSTTSNGGGINIIATGANTSIDNNMIRGNQGIIGGGIYQASANDPQITNNLIIDNVAFVDATSAGGGVYLAPNSVTTMLHNTLNDNYTEAVMGGGLYVGDAASVTLANNIMWGNYDMCDGACIGDVEVGTSVTITSSFNDVGDSGAYTFAGTGDISLAPLFVRNWYLDNVLSTSPAIDPVDASIDLPAYLSALTTPTTVVAGTTDASGGDTVDMGYHHDSAAPLVNETISVVSANPASVTLVGQTDTITVIPMDASNQWLGSGQEVWIDMASPDGSVFTGQPVCEIDQSITGLSCPMVDNGDGTYTITYDNSTSSCLSACVADTVTVTVNGVPLTTTITYTFNAPP